MSARENGSWTPAHVGLLVSWWLLAACSPTLDWRENVVAGSGLMTSFPCRPDHQSRMVDVADRKVQIDMLVCTAGDITYAVSFFDVSEPAQVSGSLAALRTALIGNVQAAAPPGGGGRPKTRVSSLQLKGMTPNPQSGRWSVDGRRPDGSTLSTQAAFFTKGLRVYQAAVVGSMLSADAVEPFFGGLKFPRMRGCARG